MVGDRVGDRLGDISMDSWNGPRSYCAHLLLDAMPFIRRITKRQMEVDYWHCHVGITVLVGLLLGVYPTSVKFPPFSVRVALYARVHRLLTHGGGMEFCRRHPCLMTLSFMEYCSSVIPAYFPVEHEQLLGEAGASAFFGSCSLACDTFRQELLVTGRESWADLEAFCVPIVEKHWRACKNRSRVVGDSVGCLRVSEAAINTFLTMPFVVPYGVHLDDALHSIMGSEMAFLSSDGSVRFDHVAAMQRMISVRSLPENVRRMQLRGVGIKMRECERSALSGAMIYVCVSCVLSAQGGKALLTRGQCRWDVETEQLVCSSCKDGAASGIVAISTIGRAIVLRGRSFYFAPCCCSVQVYQGRGNEFASGVECPHQRQRATARAPRRRCEVCSNAAASQGHTAVDHLTGVMHTMWLCHRHTPHESILRHVVNWAQLKEEVAKRDRPLFVGGKKRF
jgi:hypothetical protein